MATTKTISDYTAAGSIDAVNDYLLIEPSGNTVYNKINRNTLLGLSSTPVGLTDSQTLTNKTLTAPTISSPVLSGTITGTYTIGGTPTFPSSVVTLTGSQTLTNKTLTSPTINTPTITNASITADTLSGFTTSNNGTVYGISVTGGTIGSAAIASGAIGSAALAANAVLSGKLGLSNAFTGGVASQANAGSAGGTMYYINLGGLKLLWGLSAGNSLANATSSTYTWTLPTSFFASIQTVLPTLAVPGAATNSAVEIGYTGASTTTITTQITNQTGGTNIISHSIIVIGT